jgi:hypothetical protein
MLRHDLDLLAGRDLLQFDELGERRPTETTSPTGNCARRPRRPAGGFDPRKETETAGDRIYQRRIVARHH